MEQTEFWSRAGQGDQGQRGHTGLGLQGFMGHGGKFLDVILEAVES